MKKRAISKDKTVSLFNIDDEKRWLNESLSEDKQSKHKKTNKEKTID